jgi:hypothetical protein
MAHGLQVFNSSGQLTLDVSDRLTRLHSVVNVSVPAYTGSTRAGTVAITGMTTDGTWYMVSEYSQTDAMQKLVCTANSGYFDWYVATTMGAGTVRVSVFRV